MGDSPAATALFEEGFDKILEGLKQLGFDTDNDANFAGTAARAARGLSQLVLDQADVKNRIDGLMQKTFPASYNEMVISKHNVAFGICPHHLLPVIYRVSVAYIPTDKVLGISKLSRLCQLMARAPILQEELTHGLARLLYKDLSSQGSAAYVEGLHMCMAARGIEAHEARVVTSAVRGVFMDEAVTRQEFLGLVTAHHPNLV